MNDSNRLDTIHLEINRLPGVVNLESTTCANGRREKTLLVAFGSNPVGPTHSLKGGEGSDGEDDVDHAGDQRAGADPPKDGYRVLLLLHPVLGGMPVLPTFAGLAVAVLVTFGALRLLPLPPPRPDEEYCLRGDGLHAVVHHEADVHDAVGTVVGYVINCAQ